MLAVLFAGIAVPTVAGAAITKVKTKIVFYGADSWTTYKGAPEYGFTNPRQWSLDTTSAGAPTVTGRLFYYRTSTKKWVGYAKRPVYLINIGQLKTDSKGYFRLKLAAPSRFGFRYPGSKYSKPATTYVTRHDVAHTESRATVTTSSVDASSTRVNVEVDYRYNRFVDDLHPMYLMGYGPGVYVRSSVVLDGIETIGSNTARNYADLDVGGGHTGWSCVLPNELLADRTLEATSKVTYASPWILSLSQ